MKASRPPDTEVVAGLSVPYRVRFDEAGPGGAVRPSTLLRYAQDCAWIHSEALGFGHEWYAERGLTWVVRSIELAVLARIGASDRLAISTAITGFRRVWARRRTLLRDADEALVASVVTDFVMTDVRRGLPARVPDDFPRLFGVPPGTFQPLRVVLPATPPTATHVVFAVRPQELDPIGHANHAAYLDWLEEAVEAMLTRPPSLARLPRTYRLEYAAAARPAMKVDGAAWPADACDGVDHHPTGDGVDYRLTGEGADLFRGTVRGGEPQDETAT